MSSPEKPAVRKDGLQLGEDRGFQERFWTIERFSWGVFALIIIAALLGAFGSGGPFATKVSELEGAIVEHPRIGRWEGTDGDGYPVQTGPHFNRALGFTLQCLCGGFPGGGYPALAGANDH